MIDKGIVKTLNDLRMKVGMIESYSELREVWDAFHNIFSERQDFLERKAGFNFSIGDLVEWSGKRGRGRWSGKIIKCSGKMATVDGMDVLGNKVTWRVAFTLLKKVTLDPMRLHQILPPKKGGVR